MPFPRESSFWGGMLTLCVGIPFLVVKIIVKCRGSILMKDKKMWMLFWVLVFIAVIIILLSLVSDRTSSALTMEQQTAVSVLIIEVASTSSD